MSQIPQPDIAGSGTDATARIAGETLHLSGRLQREAVAALWASLPRAQAISAIDLSGVTALDTAGLALLVCVVRRANVRAKAIPVLLHPPSSYASLCAAYRIGSTLEGVSHEQSVG